MQDSQSVLKYNHPGDDAQGNPLAEPWAGVTLAEGFGNTDFVADRDGVVTMKVWAEARADGSAPTVLLVVEDSASAQPNAGNANWMSVEKTLTPGEWNTVTFDFSSPTYSGGDTSATFDKLILKSGVGDTLYVDEVVAQGADLVLPTLLPTVAAPAPQEAAADVISVYSNQYTDIAVGNMNPNWGEASQLNSTPWMPNKAAIGDVLHMTNLSYQGIEFGAAQDLTVQLVIVDSQV